MGVWVCLPEGVTQAVTGTPLTEKASVKPKKPLENEKRTRKRRATAGRKEPKSDYLAACVPPAHLAACEDPVWSLIAVSPAAFDRQSRAKPQASESPRGHGKIEEMISEGPPSLGLCTCCAPRWGSHHSPQWDSGATHT